MSGQINMGTEFGNTIYDISKNPNYLSFCEVGTWNGCGSTKCIFEGIKNRPDTILYSIEGDKNMFEGAQDIWKNVPNIHIMYGTLHRNIMTPQEILNHPLYMEKKIIRAHYELWYMTELKTVRETPLVSVPKCDVIMLDGGEFSTSGDWNVLYHDNLKVVILDDTQVIKTNLIRLQLLNDPNWKCLHDQTFDRNGWSIFERI